jgi:alpha-tubulin suppressor-like RCC1 family protein/uncharacterized protein YjdB
MALLVVPPPVATVTVTLASTTLTVGQSAQASAVLKDGAGNTLTGRAVTWTSSDVAVATVSASGLVQGLFPGLATITATAEGKSGTSALTVTPPPVATVNVELGAPSLVVGKSAQASAVLRDERGTLLTGRTVAWSSSNVGVATVTPTGLVTAVAVGSVTLTATSEGKSGSTGLAIVPPPVATISVSLASATVIIGQSTTATPTLRDADGNVLTGRSIVWSSAEPTIATVSPDGVVTGVAQGTALIFASSEGTTGRAQVSVIRAPVASVTVALASGSLLVGQNTQAAATLRDAGGGVLAGRTVTWTSSNPSIAPVSGNGSGATVTAIAPGSVTISATSEGVTGVSSTLTVSLVPVASVVLVPPTPFPACVSIGSSLAFQVVLKDGSGNVLSGRVVAWSTSNPAVATVSTEGVVTGIAPGTMSLTAASEGKSASSSITVCQRSVASVTVTVNSATLIVGQTTQASATVRDALGNSLTGRAVARTSSNPAVATVSTTGVITAVAPGTVTVTATSEGVSGTSPALTILPVPVASVTVSLRSTSLNVGQTTGATATAKDAQGNVLAGRPVTWTSSAPAVATVSGTGASGLVSAVSPGTASITATVDGVGGSSGLTVAPVPVASVTIAPGNATIQLGQSVQLSATARDAQGNVLSGRPITWSSSDAATATVSAAGLAAGVAVGGPVTISASAEGKVGVATVSIGPLPVRTGTRLVATGGHFSCALKGTSTYCWGDNYKGQLGDGTITQRLLPVQVVGAPAFVAITAGSNFACGLTAQGAAHCWGDNQFGQLGNGTLTDSRTPVPVAGGMAFVDIVSGFNFTCALTASGRVYCWGFNPWGQLGDGTTTNRSIPTAVAGGNLTLVGVDAGSQYACGLAPDGARYCWGQNGRGQFGNGSTTNSLIPVRSTLGPAVSQLTVGGEHSCALAITGTAYCWGFNNYGQVGDGTFVDRTSPTAVSGGPAFTRVTNGDATSCGATVAGVTYCWGKNDGVFGDGKNTHSVSPVPAGGNLTLVGLAIGTHHSCGLTSVGAVYCWGSNPLGQLGNGTTIYQLSPVLVVIP